MFRDTLIESSSTGRKRKRWPMIVAVTLEVLVGAALIALPLLSTGVIPISAHITRIAPLGRVNAARPPEGHPNGGGVAILQPVALDPTRRCFSCKPVETTGTGNDESQPPTIGWSNGPAVPDLDMRPSRDVPAQEQPRKKIISLSHLSEGQLLNKVEPVYPRIALISGVKGVVRLHAIIARDGTIQSLTVVSGHPMLVAAARDAVSQWRYRPYLLNGEPVEVETFITVSFK